MVSDRPVSHRLIHSLARVLACAWLLLDVGLVAAEPSAAERETARALMQEGDRLSAVGDLRGALARYQSAHAIMHVPTTGIDVARSQAQLGMLVEARGLAVEVSNSQGAAHEPRVFAEARVAAATLAAQLDKRIPSVSARVTPADATYTVTIDGVALPREAGDVAFRTDPGAHAVMVECPGYASQTVQVALVEGEAEVVSFALVAASAPAIAGPSPMLAPGSSTSVQAVATGGTEVVDHADPSRAGRVRSIIGFGLGGVALVIGGVSGALSLSKVSSLKPMCPDDRCSPAQADKLSSANTLANVANVTIPLGLLGVAYGIYELLTLPSTPQEPAVGPQSMNFQLELTGSGMLVKGTL